MGSVDEKNRRLKKSYASEPLNSVRSWVGGTRNGTLPWTELGAQIHRFIKTFVTEPCLRIFLCHRQYFRRIPRQTRHYKTLDLRGEIKFFLGLFLIRRKINWVLFKSEFNSKFTRPIKTGLPTLIEVKPFTGRAKIRNISCDKLGLEHYSCSHAAFTKHGSMKRIWSFVCIFHGSGLQGMANVINKTLKPFQK